MAHSPDKRSQVREAYLTGTTLEDAAVGAGVALSTARRWRAEAIRSGDDWERLRSASMVTGPGRDAAVHEILRCFLMAHERAIHEVGEAEMTATQRVEALARLSDAFNKTMSSAAKASPKLGRLGVAQDILTWLAEFVRGRFPQHGPAFLEILEPFGAELTGRYDD